MKKILLNLILALCISGVNAQTPAGSAHEAVPVSNNAPILSESNNPPSPSPSVKKQLRRIQPFKSAVNCPGLNSSQMGSQGNAFGTAWGSRTNLWYDPNINTIIFVHRSTIGVSHATSIADLTYDYSPNGGATWYPDIPIDTTIGIGYPQGVIYNPPGNTNPSGAFITAFAPATNGTYWYGYCEETSPIGDTIYKQKIDSVNNSIADGMQIVKNTGTVWTAAAKIDTGGVYRDSIIIGMGTFNASDSTFNYNFSHTFYAYLDTFAHLSTAWSDNGQIGYLVIIGNDQQPFVDSVLYPIVYKTINAGNTWTKMTNQTNLSLEVLDHMLANNGSVYSTDNDVDCAVDSNNNLHIAVAVGVSADTFGINATYGYWGIFDIYTPDGGTTWYGQMVGKPESFSCTYGVTGSTTDPPITEQNRPQVTRSYDGSKIFISWFETDTAEFGTGTASTGSNCSPDWRVRGFDISTMGSNNLWTDSLNMTDLTAADGFCSFANVSYYSITNGSSECIPMVYGDPLTVTNTGEAMQFYYASCGCVDANGYVFPANPCMLSNGNSCNLPPFGPLNTGIKEYGNSDFAVSANYPNPFTGNTMVDVTLTKPENVTIEVSDMVGQILSTKTYINLSTGVSHLAIKASDLAAGIYLYKVTVGDEMVVRTMAVK